MTLPIFLAILMFAAGCNSQNQSIQERTETSAEDVKQKVEEAWETGFDYTQEQQQKYQKEIQTQLDDFDNRIEELRAEAENAGEEVEIALNERIEILEQKREEAEQSLETLTSSGDEAWKEVKGGLDKAIGDLQQTYERAVTEFDDRVRSN